MPDIGAFFCECADIFSGEVCNGTEGAFNPCHPSHLTGHSCDGNASCIYNKTVHPPGNHSCECLPGFLGDGQAGNCTDINECPPGQCFNGGACRESYTDASVPAGEFNCTPCDDGYTGERCETDIDECAETPCANGGTCTDGVASFACTCADGFVGETCTEAVSYTHLTLPTNREV